MPTPQEVNAKLSKFAALVPVVGSCTSVPIIDIVAALGPIDFVQAIATFTEWAEANGMRTVQLTTGLMMLGRHLG